MIPNSDKLSAYLDYFFNRYLPQHRAVSPHTRLNYKQAFIQLLRFWKRRFPTCPNPDLDRFQVERRIERTSAGKPVQLALAEREQVVGPRERQDLLAPSCRRPLRKDRDLEFSRGRLDELGGERLHRSDCPHLLRGSQKRGHGVAELLRVE